MYNPRVIKSAKKQPLLFVELLFWKTRKESHYINAEVLMGGLVKMKKDIRNLDREGIRNLDREGINLSNDKERPARKSLADSLGDDDADLVVPHDFSYQWQDSNKEAEDLSDGDDQKGLRKIKASAVKRRSAAISMNNENDEDKSEGATPDSQALNVSKRQKRPVFDEEQEFAIKDLYAKYKDDRRCNHLIAEALDPDGKISPTQVSRKLKKLGLKVASREKLASSDLDGAVCDGFTSSSTPYSSNKPEDELLLKTSPIVLEQMALQTNHHHLEGNHSIPARFNVNLQILNQLRCQVLMVRVSKSEVPDWRRNRIAI